MSRLESKPVKRRRYTFQGIIQGVGFRPTVYRVAVSLSLAGFVQNRRSEVVAEVEGPEDMLDRFLTKLDELLPEAAEIRQTAEELLETVGDPEFRIIGSVSSDYNVPPIPPDLSICRECREELFKPSNRRYLYPFITCTQCGPRYSIVEDTPFDRDTTSMIDFPQCTDCLGEYTDPMDRRFHSQTNSCEVCGPELTLTDTAGRIVPGDPVAGTIRLLSEGKILAIQGIGGFHIAVDPSRSGAVETLRKDKERERKPFALMVRDLGEARRLCLITGAEEKILQSPESPILILPEQEGIPEYLNKVSDTGTLGIMLPYTPLHLLLFFHPERDIPYRHLIMTSGNRKDEPILTDPEEAKKKLAGRVHYVLYNNRRIIFRNDDSILRSLSLPGDGEAREPYRDTCILRRSRGYVPKILRISRDVETTTLAVGGDLKSAPGFARGRDMYLSPYIGDLGNVATFHQFEKQIEKILRLYGVQPGRIVYDLHPGYRSTAWAEKQDVDHRIQVQHHHAHILSAMAEHDLEEVLGLSFDGTGYGPDGTVWGGEFLHATRRGFKRLGRFAPFPLPGGDAAVLHPARTAYALFESQGRGGELNENLFNLPHREVLREMIHRGINSPLTSSLGRIFDAASAILGIVDEVTFEGEGPVRMEGFALQEFIREGPNQNVQEESYLSAVSVPERDLLFEIDPLLLLGPLVNRREGAPVSPSALSFHRAVAEAAFQGVECMKRETGITHLALSGGVFQNMLLKALLVSRLESAGMKVFENVNIPPGDGGIAVGQAYIVE